MLKMKKMKKIHLFSPICTRLDSLFFFFKVKFLKIYIFECILNTWLIKHHCDKIKYYLHTDN